MDTFSQKEPLGPGSHSTSLKGLQARAQRPHTPYKSHLTTALDMRGWGHGPPWGRPARTHGVALSHWQRSGLSSPVRRVHLADGLALPAQVAECMAQLSVFPPRDPDTSLGQSPLFPHPVPLFLGPLSLILRVVVWAERIIGGNTPSAWSAIPQFTQHPRLPRGDGPWGADPGRR